VSGCPREKDSPAAGERPDNRLVDIEGFVRDGYVAVRRAVDADVAAACADEIWAALAAEGVSRTDRRSWTRPCVRVNCPEGAPFAAAGTSPALTSVYDELLGPGRWTRRAGVGGTVPVRFPSEEDPGDAGHHIEGSFRGDGDWWVNVRSRGRGLLALFLFSDVGPDDAPTRLVLGSHLWVPRVLAPAGEAGMSFGPVAARLPPSVLSRRTVEAAGRAGDVFVCHPFIVHTATWPHRGSAARLVAQPGIEVAGGFDIDGSDPSPVARAIVAGLAKDW
jgi:Phytanoyl-CoA dioxygenase (PhyH)